MSDLLNEFQESDLEVLKQYHEFIRDDEIDEIRQQDWRIRLARRYYDQLYKEYALADLSHYQAGLIGFRWRTEDEVLSGKGQSFCGAIYCSAIEGIKTFEVPFGYEEARVSKAELVKISLCKKCSKKLKHYQDSQDQSEKGKDQSKKKPKR